MSSLKKFRYVNLVVILVVLFNTLGCTHSLEIKNLDMYYNESLNSLTEEKRIGIKSVAKGMDGKKMVKAMAESLSKYNAEVTTISGNNLKDADVVATISIQSDYKGSGMNFLINFPGFLIFAPAWHGYNYQIKHEIHVLLTDAETNEELGKVDLPVVLNIRHADFNRTWTEISWFEFGIIAFIGGIVFISYDENVTPLAAEKAGPVIADYLAQDIVNILRSN